MSGQRNINTGGGNYNESISGNYIHNNYYTKNYTDYTFISLQQDVSKIALNLQSLAEQLQAQGCNSAEAQQKIAHALVDKVKSDSSLKPRLIQLGKYLSDAAANGLVSEIAVEAVKMALSLLGFPC